MSEKKKLSQEEIAALLINRAKEKAEPVRALSDDELGGVAGGSYTISNKDGTRVTVCCTHPGTAVSNPRNYIQIELACDYGQAAGAATCDNCPYLQIGISADFSTGE